MIIHFMRARKLWFETEVYYPFQRQIVRSGDDNVVDDNSNGNCCNSIMSFLFNCNMIIHMFTSISVMIVYLSLAVLYFLHGTSSSIMDIQNSPWEITLS
jgi:hypothetical protein